MLAASVTFAVCWLLISQPASADDPPARAATAEALFAREKLVAWCIVPFDSKRRGPEERAAMLERLGFKRFAYDYRAEHIPTFDAEMAALKKRGIELTAWWFPTSLNDEARLILDVLKRHGIKAQLWVTGGGGPTNSAEEQRARIVAEAARIRPIADAAAQIGCSVALYNHGGWFGEPENQIAIIDELKLPNLGIVYNQHHGHDHLARFPELLKKMLPHLRALNLNGMVKDGERLGKKILPLGQGNLDLALLKSIRDSGYRGPIGILGHTQDDAEERLRDNLDGLDWLVPQLAGKPAGRQPKPRTMSPAAAPANAGKPALGEGKFGRSLDARGGGVLIVGKEDYRQPPLTLECWAKLPDGKPYNILVAQELKSSATHWELFTMAGSGQLTVYLPGMKPDHVRSSTVITDGQWHYVAMIFEPARVRLFADGKQVADQAVEFQKGATVPGDFAIGQLVNREIGCTGWIDDVRLSRGVREMTGIPDKPLPVDERTIGLWRFDGLSENRESRDESTFRNPAKFAASAAPPPANGAPDHFGKQSVGFDWTEQDSADNRWNQSDVGPFLACAVPIPGQRQPVGKGLSIRVGPQREATICYDTGQLSARAGWFDGFLQFHPARYGLINMPAIGGKLAWASESSSAGPPPATQFRGLHLQNERVVLSYLWGAATVRESPWLEVRNGLRAFTRTLEVEAHASQLSLDIGHFVGAGRADNRNGQRVVFVEHGDHTLAIALVQAEIPDAVTLQFSRTNGETAATRVSATIPASRAIRRFKIVLWTGSKSDAASFGVFVDQSPSPENLELLTNPGKPHWTAEITTRGTVGKNDAPYVLDTLSLPFDNPYKALFFVSGHDFFANGDIAICTVHGDVWRVSGVDERLEKLTWRRFATGMFQPLGLRIVNDAVYVLGRDQITRLHDRNGDGEADFYECFNNAAQTSPGGHDYVACLETDAAGNFYFVHAIQGLMRVSADGRKMESVAAGFRNPNGLSIGPGDIVTVSPQEGNWTPASAICEVRPGGYYGYDGPRVSADRPLGYDPPLCWIPRMHDNSSGGQTWVTSDRWGPLAGQLLHLSFGKCRLMLVLREKTFAATQGATVDFPLDFSSGVMRGRFHPRDGQLYVSGLKGWVSAAVQDGCLQRVRYTGRPVTMPIAMRTMSNGIALRFTQPLELHSAEDPDNYHVQRWNYLYSAGYGSPDFKVSDATQEGRDGVDVVSATLMDEGHSVFLEIPDNRPAMQMKIGYTLKTAAGDAVRQAVYPTIHRVASDGMDESDLHRRARPGQLAREVVESLRPGVAVHFEQATQSDARVDRMFAWHVPSNTAPALFLNVGRFRAVATAYLRTDLRGDFRFRLVGNGRAALRINGQKVFDGMIEQAAAVSADIRLHKGFNRIELSYSSPAAGDATCRLLWSSAEFAEEPVPPTVLYYADDPQQQAAAQLRNGHWLFVERRCDKCHVRPKLAAAVLAVPAVRASLDGPRFTGIGSRLNSEWTYRWLLNPRAMHDAASMPRLFDEQNPASRQEAADIAAYLGSLVAESDGAGSTRVAESPSTSDVSGTELYEDFGCLACHRLTPPAASDEHRRMSLYYSVAKFRDGELLRYLAKPQLHFAGTRMPDFGLSGSEAAALAGALQTAARGRFEPAEELSRADARRGQELVRSRQCLACHEFGPGAPRPQQRLVELRPAPGDRGCLASDDAARRQSPNFDLRASDREALQRFLATGGATLYRRVLAEEAERLIQSLNCTGCHNRDQHASPLRSLMADESERGVVPEPLPNLTWAGEKLHSDWLAALLRGNVKYRSRPWLKARMPAFPEFAETLAAGLAMQHGLSPVADRSFAAKPELVEIGRQLTGANPGLDCRQCHAIGRDQPTGDEKTKIAVGINFAHTRERLRPDFYRRFVLDPPRFEINSKMPKLAPDGRTTKVVHVFDGDATRQFDALWHFIQRVKMPDDGTLRGTP